MSNTIDGNTYINGNLSARSMSMPAGTVTDAGVNAAAAVQATKLLHQYEVVYSQDSSTDATVERRVIHIVKGATATLAEFAAGSVSLASAGGNAVVDLLKNGSTVLTGTITLDSTNTVYVLETAPGYTSTSLVAGDVLEFKLTSAAATKPKGVFCRLTIQNEAAQ